MGKRSASSQQQQTYRGHISQMKHGSWLGSLLNRVGFEGRANEIVRAITLVVIWGLLVWFGFYEIEAAERGEDTLLTWYVVVTATAVVALLYQRWQQSD
jgi:hypothetical protein